MNTYSQDDQYMYLPYRNVKREKAKPWPLYEEKRYF